MLNRHPLRIRPNPKQPRSLLQLPVRRVSGADQGQGRSHPRTGWLVITGLLGLQLLILGAILARIWLIPGDVSGDDTAAAYYAPEQVAVEPALIEPALSPTAAPDYQPVINLDPVPAAAPGTVPLPRTASLRLRGLEISQGIQVFNEPEHPRCHPDSNHPDHIFCNNSIPAVAGRHTLVRVYLGCGDGCPAGETLVRLSSIKAGQEQGSLSQRLSAADLRRVDSLSLLDIRGQLENSLNFEFIPPPAWLNGEVTFKLEVITPPELDRPAFEYSLTKNFAERRPLRVAYLPVEINGAAPDGLQETAYWLQRMYPVAQVEYYRLPMPAMVWQGELRKSDLLHQLLYSYWFYAQAQPETARPDQLFGWLPQTAYNGGASDPFWCPTCAGPHSSRVAFGGLRPEQDIGGPRILAHEIAHNLGAQHAWSPTYDEDSACFRAAGVDIRVDPEWPYVDTPHIQEFGLDLYSVPPVIYPPSYYDMMAYCAQPWISPHTYRKIFESPLLDSNGSASDDRLAVAGDDGGVALVSGVIEPNGAASPPELVKLSAGAFGLADGFTPPLAFTPPPGNDYCLTLQTAAGQSAHHCFEVGFEDLETGLPTESARYFLALPLTDLQAITKVSLSQDQTEVAAAWPSAAPPQLELVSPLGGETLSRRATLTWQAHDPDGDRLRFDVLYSPDDGHRWLPLATHLSGTSYTFSTEPLIHADRLRLRLMAHDGFHTTLVDTGAPLRLELSAGDGLRARDKQF